MPQRGQRDYGNRIVIKSLLGMLTKRPAEKAPKKTAADALRKVHNPGTDFRAVAISSTGVCCLAAKNAAGKRFLMRAAPRLPLAECSLPENCACKFRKNSDRREGDRRLFGGTGTNRWFAGTDNRQRKSRRSTII